MPSFQNKLHREFFLLVLFGLAFCRAFAQPANDNCVAASAITLSESGFGLGTFTSSTINLTAATVQPGETFAPAVLVAGQDQKSIWYKFSLPTTRSVRVTLTQPGIDITAGDVGFAVYKTTACLPDGDSISTKLTPIALFGNTYHPCVDPGEYLIHVSGKKTANGPLSITLEVAAAAPAPYDLPGQAYSFGTLKQAVTHVDYEVDCHSLDNAAERCPGLAHAADYTKSTWHTFTTPAYFDYLSVLLASPEGRFTPAGTRKFGYRLYKGDASKTPVSDLALVDGCDSLVTNGYTPDYRSYKCFELQPGTTYSVQLLFHKDFAEKIRLALAYGGTAPTQAPEPILSRVPPSNNPGSLNAGLFTATDYLACNSRHSLHPCTPSLPENGLVYRGKRYPLSTFYTFTLSSTSNTTIRVNPQQCGPPLLLRLYQQGLTNDCHRLDTSTLLQESLSSIQLECLLPGTYTVQVSGSDSALPVANLNYRSLESRSTPLCLFSNLGQGISLSVDYRPLAMANRFGLAQPGGFDTLNGLKPLQNGTAYRAVENFFDCLPTVLPLDTLCGTNTTRAMYRQFVVGDSGVVLFSSRNNSLRYKLYQGDANALATDQDAHSFPARFRGLTPYSDCQDASSPCIDDRVCVVPGTYTYATFGNENTIGTRYADRPTVTFRTLSTLHNRPQAAQNMGSILDTAKTLGRTSVLSDDDYFSCYDNAVPINGYQPCTINGRQATKAIYRQFYLSEPSVIEINGDVDCSGMRSYQTLFSGRATEGLAGLTPVGANWSCFDRARVTDNCQPLPAGWYTVVSYGIGPSYQIPRKDINQGPYSSYVGLMSRLEISITKITALNRFDLGAPGRFDSVNALQSLERDKTYRAESSSFDCQNSVLPEETACGTGTTKAMYRQFVVGESGVVTFASKANPLRYQLFKGDANALADAQKVHLPADRIKGLQPYSECFDYADNCSRDKVCLVPGTYTFATFGNSQNVGASDRPSFTFEVIETAHSTPAAAQNMGSVIDSAETRGRTSVTSDRDYFSCRDNAVAINGYQPCTIIGKQATKAIYRQFYLSSPALVTITTSTGCGYDGLLTLFSGKTSDGLSSLNVMPEPWQCFTSTSVPNNCSPLPAGWYTVVAYGSGPTYDHPMQHLNGNGYASSVGLISQLSITLKKSCPGPQFNRPYTAAVDTATKQPFLLQWGPRKGHTDASPKTDTTYRLYTEYFNCIVDTPFTFVAPCTAPVNRVAYYVFRTTQESYVQINTQGFWSAVYGLDIRKDSAQFKGAAPLQTCLQSTGQIQLCRLQPGTYTLVLFAGDQHNCSSVTPTIYIEGVGYSRFDHAAKAYDFGLIPADSAYHNGHKGDVNPDNTNRAPSSDFFYCTTGAQKDDPTDAACRVDYLPSIYNNQPNQAYYPSPDVPNPSYVPRRNLWYTFVVDKPGYVRVKVTNKTAGKLSQYPFAVYRSNVDGTLPFSEVVGSGLVDSTRAQGLTLVKTNLNGSCSGSTELSFFRELCAATTDRYYIVVENRNASNLEAMNPNSQVEVSILLDTIDATPTRFDHYYQASDIGHLKAGTYKGATDNFACATADATDPIDDYRYCAKKTLWYKFTTPLSGHVRYRVYIDGKREYSSYSVQLFRQLIPGDSTTKGLSFEKTTSYYDNTTRSYWAQTCVAPGTYYLVLTGCEGLNQFVYPEVQLVEEAGDFCSAPVTAALRGTGSVVSSLVVDCHTIGTDYGEYNPTLTCPPGAATQAYKTSWFRIDVTGDDTLDVTAFIEEKTTAASSDIKYRLMFGDCGAMVETSCVQDARTQNTYECLTKGSYYIQVFTPVSIGRTPVTGSIDLHLSAALHKGACAPRDACLASARFTPQFDCTKDSAVRFVNNSTYGSAIRYNWDFGFAGQKSSETSPSFFYPALSTDKTYSVKLVVENSSCGKRDSVTVPVTVPGRPHAALGAHIWSCTETSVTLRATSHPGTTYRWQDGSTDSVFVVRTTGQGRYAVQVLYNNCISKDTIQVYISPLKSKAVQSAVLCTDSVRLSAARPNSPAYRWNTGETSDHLYAKAAGIYWADITLDGCTIRDSFRVTGAAGSHPLGRDTAFCFTSAGYQLDATVSGASSYRWQDGSTGAQYTVKSPGVYWVDIELTGCKTRDSVTVSAGGSLAPVIKGPSSFCAGDSVVLDAGPYASYLWNTGDTARTITVQKGGSYWVTVKIGTGCTGSDTVSVTLNQKPAPSISGNRPLCSGDSLQLEGPTGFATYAWSTGQRSRNIVVKTAGMLTLTVTDANGCAGTGTVQVTVGPPAKTMDTSVQVCSGSGYQLPSGRVVRAAGVYRDTLFAASGCDSLVATIRLDVATALRKEVSATLCSGQLYTLPSGQKTGTAGTYTDTLKSGGGCDSIVVVFLTVGTTLRTDTTVRICAGQVYRLPSGLQVNQSGVYVDTLAATGGCDSIITTRLTVSSSLTSSQNIVICPGQTYRLPSGRTVSTTGTYTDHLKAATGCDSSVVTNLEVRPFLTQTVTKEICRGGSYRLPSGRVVTSSGLYTDTLLSSAGCDSIITTRLTLSSLQTVSSALALCPGQAYTLPSGAVVQSAGVYADTLKNQAGCDSLITLLTVSVQQARTENKTVWICSGQYIILPSGDTATREGLYRTVVKNRADCDSLVTNTTVQVQQRQSVGITPTAARICSGDSVQLTSFGGDRYQWLTPEGVVLPGNTSVWVAPSVTAAYRVVVYNDLCSLADTVASVIMVDPLPKATATKSNDINCTIGTAQLKATGGTQYRWSPAATLSNAAVPNPVARPEQTTVYRVQVTSDSGCVAEQSIEVKVIPGQSDYNLPNAFTPNGDGLNDCFGVKNWGVISNLQFTIFNRWGEIVFSTTDPSQCWDGLINQKAQRSEVFVYLVRANTICGRVERRGIVTLIR